MLSKYWNLQTLHQILSVGSFLGAGLGWLLLQAGCSETSVGYDCTGSTWPAWSIPWLIAAGAILVALKPLVTLIQGGPRALVRPMVVVPSRDQETGKFKSK